MPNSEMGTRVAVGNVEVGGVELHCAEQGTGPPLILIHGSLADYSYWSWAGQLARLAEQARVIAYSRRYNYPNANHAARPETVPTDHSALVEANDLLGLADALGLGSFHLVGHSYGAYTALLFALEHPRRLRSLVLAEPPLLSWLPSLPGGAERFESFMKTVWTPLGEVFKTQGTDAGLEFTSRWYFGLPLAEAPPAWGEMFRRNAREWQALAVSNDAFPLVDPAAVGALRVPTLLLSGGKNAGGFNALIDGELERLLPQARRVVVAGASHEMFLDAPDISARALLEHISQR